MQVVSQEFLTIRARPWRWPNTTRFLVLGSEIPLVISHGVNQNFGGKFLCQLHINSCYLTVREKSYAEIFCGKNAEKCVNYMESTLDCAEVSAVNKIDNKTS